MTSVAFVGTYPPRQCGIATFTRDVVEAIKPFCKSVVVALGDGDYAYPREVIHRLDEDCKDAYSLAAECLNRSGVHVVSLQHEYGIFGGEDGRYILEFLRALEKPVVATLHTVIPKPTRGQLEVLHRIGRKARRVVVMTPSATAILHRVYGIPQEKIVLIHHGAPPPVDKEKAKRRLGLPAENGLILSTFGLIGPGKGLEYAIEAMRYVVKRYPETQYYILGRTHPKLIVNGRDPYRKKLQIMVERWRLGNNVRFIDRYLEFQDLLHWLAVTDVYITPYPGLDQITSGTLTYAVAAGKAIVSTPYLYARDLLAQDRGILVDFEDPRELPGRLADALLQLIELPELRRSLERRTRSFSRHLQWPSIGKAYAELFEAVTRATCFKPARPQSAVATECTPFKTA